MTAHTANTCRCELINVFHYVVCTTRVYQITIYKFEVYWTAHHLDN